MKKKNFFLFDISKVFITITVIPKFDFPKMSTSEVIDVQSSHLWTDAEADTDTDGDASIV